MKSLQESLFDKDLATRDTFFESLLKLFKKKLNKQTINGAGKHTLNYGDNRINVEVTSENGMTNTYEIMVTRKDNRLKNTALKSLSVSNTDIIVSRSVSSVFIAATPEVENSTLTGTGTKQLEIGLNTFTLTVIGDDGSSQNYTIYITRSTEELQKEIESTNLLNFIEMQGIQNSQNNLEKEEQSWMTHTS